MANTTQWNRAGDYNLVELSMVFSDDTKIDISHFAQQIEIFESIYNNSWTGTIIFKDTTSIIEQHNITGSEKIILHLTTDLTKFYTIKKEFIIAKISDFIQNGKENYYTLHLVTTPVYYSRNYKISLSYNDYAENIIRSVYNDTMGIDNDIIYDFTKYPRKLVIPSMTPFKLFKYLADTSILDTSNNDLSAGFIFYESSVGHNFRYLKGLYDDGEPFIINERDKNTPNEKIENLDVAISHYLPTMFNNVNNQLSGLYGSTAITHNIINKKIENHYYSYNGTLAQPKQYSTSNRLYFTSSDYDNHMSKNWSRIAAADKQAFDNYNLILDIYGNTNITVGETVIYNQRSNILGSNQKHKIFPRKHLITNIKHTIVNGIYKQTLELSANEWSI